MSHPIPNTHFFFFNDTATTEIYTLSLHDALPIFKHNQSNDTQNKASTHQQPGIPPCQLMVDKCIYGWSIDTLVNHQLTRSEEHTSELQSRLHLVCRLLLEKKKTTAHRVRQLHDPY